MELSAKESVKTYVRVRFAPSPTGYLHLGGARTALYNWLFARGNEGKFILRIEDTDLKRSEEGYMRQIITDMHWLGLEWDEGPEKGGPFEPYFQSKRTSVYNRYCEALIKSGKAYYCFCKTRMPEERKKEAENPDDLHSYDDRCRNLSPGEVTKMLESSEPAAVRFKVPGEGCTKFFDLIRKEIRINNKEIDDFIIVRSDGTHTYNFTVVVDDLEMKISHVIRGDDHISNTPKQVLIYKGLGKAPPIYAHIPMILGPDGTRLSKRHGATSVNAYRQMGFLPEVMVNYLALLGWSFDDKQNLFTAQELIEKFSLKAVSKRAAIFDTKKLIWMNGVYIRNLDMDKLLSMVRPYLEDKFGHNLADDKQLKNVLAAIQPRLKCLSDVIDLTDYFWREEIHYQPDAIHQLTKGPKVVSILKSLQGHLSVLKFFSQDDLEKTCRESAAKLEIKLGDLVHPLRAAVTGKTASPGLFEILALLGKEKVLHRIETAINFIEQKKID